MHAKRSLILAIGAVVALGLGACGGFKPTATAQGGGGGTDKPPATADGKAIYERQCAACHGANGGGGIGPAFSKDANTKLLEVFPEEATQVEFVGKGSAAYPDGYGATKKKGTGAMPGFSSGLKPEEIDAVVKYERSLAGG